MSDPTDPAGRRANGLPATDWGALVDLDPRLSEGLLDRLAAAGVAAYVEPAAAVDTVHRGVTHPSRPLDRLWVDPSRADSAREVVATEVAELTALLAEDEPGATAHGLVQPVPSSAARRVLSPPLLPGPPSLPTPAPPPAQRPDDLARGDLGLGDLGIGDLGFGDLGVSDLGLGGVDRPAAGDDLPAMPRSGMPPRPASDDDVFAQLVAQFHSDDVYTRDGGEHGPRWPEAEDLPRPGDELRRRRTDPPPPPPPVALPAWLEPEALEDEGHFVPPPPPPVPRIRLQTLGCLLAVVLGVLTLFAPGLLRLTATRGVMVLGLALLAGGAAALVWSMRDSSGEGPDDGAVV